MRYGTVWQRRSQCAREVGSYEPFFIYQVVVEDGSRSRYCVFWYTSRPIYTGRQSAPFGVCGRVRTRDGENPTVPNDSVRACVVVGGNTIVLLSMASSFQGLALC